MEKAKINQKDHKEVGEKKEEKSDLVKKFDGNTNTNNSLKVAVVFIAMIVLGVGTGFLIAKGMQSGGGSGGTTAQVESEDQIEVGKVFGSDDTETFSDTAEGKLKDAAMSMCIKVI